MYIVMMALIIFLPMPDSDNKAAAQMSASGVMMINIVLTAIGVLLGLFVNKNYAKMLENAEN